MNCSCCNAPKNVNDLDNTFDLDSARDDARAYRKHGLDRRTQKFVALFAERLRHSADSRDNSKLPRLLEIGGGAGALHQELLRQAKIAHATGIDASSGYLTAARENAAYFGLEDQLSYRQADFALDQEPIDSAEIVVLDRVICCYPDLNQLLGKAANHANHLLAITYPVDRWYTRWVVAGVNGVLTLMGSGYHPYVHREAEINAVAKSAGLAGVASARHHIWQMQLFERVTPA
jgi:magnesium-protoporphyrin O-methyltransferase